MLFNLLRFCVPNACVLIVCKAWDMKHTFIWKKRFKKYWNQTCCPPKTEERELVEHNFGVVAGVLLLSCSEACKLGSEGCSVWWGREFLNLQPLSQGPCSVLTKVRIDCFHRLFGNWGAHSIISVVPIPFNVQLFDPSEHSGWCRMNLLVSSLEAPRNSC